MLPALILIVLQCGSAQLMGGIGGLPVYMGHKIIKTRSIFCRS